MLTKQAARKRSQRMYPEIPPCQECGSTRMVHRHHDDYQRPEAVRFLCTDCHPKADQETGTRTTRRMKTCVVCGVEFNNYTHSRVKTCSAACLSEMGRRNAMKRWHPTTRSGSAAA